MSIRRRVAFFGSPEWAVPVARSLREHHDLVFVVTQPDKPAGRGLTLTPCAVAAWAAAEDLQTAKPSKLRTNQDFLQLIQSLDLDVAITAAYGKILPQSLLDIPKFGFLNIHPSDLPRYRGPAPVQWTLINGDTETAVCVMQTDAGMDTGPVLARFRSAVLPHENAIELSDRLRDKGTEMLLECLQKLESLEQNPQPAGGTHAPMLNKDTGKIDWTQPAQNIYNRHRGVQPWPGSWFEFEGKRVKVGAMSLRETPSSEPAKIAEIEESIAIATPQGAIVLEVVQPEGKKPMAASDWSRGQRLRAGMVI